MIINDYVLWTRLSSVSQASNNTLIVGIDVIDVTKFREVMENIIEFWNLCKHCNKLIVFNNIVENQIDFVFRSQSICCYINISVMSFNLLYYYYGSATQLHTIATFFVSTTPVLRNFYIIIYKHV